MSYDPDPGRRRRRRRTHDPARRGRVPPQLRAWVFGRRRRTHDPRRSGARADHKPYGVGKRGGVYWSGAKKRRYDPQRFARVRRYGRRIGGKMEGFINKYGGWIGAGLAALAGVGGAFQSLGTVTYPDGVGNKNMFERYWWLLQREFTHLYNFDPNVPFSMHPNSQPNYLKYKFVDSAWALPFWASLIGFIASKLPLPIPSWARIRKPLGKIAAPALVISTIGALVLPGTSPDYPKSNSSFATPSNISLNVSVHN